MPAANTTVTANYAASGGGTPPPPTTYTLTVQNGSGSGTYSAGTVVAIAANAPPAGQSFANWTGATLQDPNAASTHLTMSAANASVTGSLSADRSRS